MDWHLLYDLATDDENVAAIQKATLTTTDFGIEPEPALLGTPEWWAAIEAGRLPTIEIEGVVSMVYWGSMNDWPSFEMTTYDGTRTKWSSLGDPTRYVEGLAVRVRYARLSRRLSQVERFGQFTDKVLQVWIEESPLRTSRGMPGPGRYEGIPIRLEYFDQNERFAEVLPREGLAVRRLQSTNGVDNFYLLRLREPFTYEGREHRYVVIRSRWKDHEIGEAEPTSVFILLVPDLHLLGEPQVDVSRLEHVAWGMANTLPGAHVDV